MALRGFPPVAPPPIGLPVGLSPLIRADNLARALGLECELYVKTETSNPTHSFKDRVVAIAAAKAVELGFEALACASTGNLAGATAAAAAALGLPTYIFVPDDLEREKILAAAAYGATVFAVDGHLRRRQPAVLGAGLRAALGVRQRQPAAVLRGGLQDGRLTRRWSSSAGGCPTGRRADRFGLAVHQDPARVPRGAWQPGWSGAAGRPVMHGAQGA